MLSLPAPIPPKKAGRLAAFFWNRKERCLLTSKSPSVRHEVDRSSRRPEELNRTATISKNFSDSLSDCSATVHSPVLVTAINPTPAGEGKTTTTVGLGQAMKKIGKNAIIALRELPCLVFIMVQAPAAAMCRYPDGDNALHTGDMHVITRPTICCAPF